MTVTIKRTVKVQPFIVISRRDDGTLHEKIMCFPCKFTAGQVEKLTGCIKAAPIGEPEGQEVDLDFPVIEKEM